MTLIEGLTAIIVFLGFGYLILAQLEKKKPGTTEKLKGLFSNPEKDKTKIIERMEQIYPEKRQIM